MFIFYLWEIENEKPNIISVQFVRVVYKPYIFNIKYYTKNSTAYTVKLVINMSMFYGITDI